MSARGRKFFDGYVSASLNDPLLKDLGVVTHVFNLTSGARAQQISPSEMVEEVGPLADALVARKRKVT